MPAGRIRRRAARRAAIALRARARTRRVSARGAGERWELRGAGSERDVRGVLGERARGGVSQRRRVPRGRRPGRGMLPGVGVRDVRRGDERGDVEGGASVTLKFFKLPVRTVRGGDGAAAGGAEDVRGVPGGMVQRARRGGRRASRVRWGRSARRSGTRSGARRAARGRRGRARWRIITKRRRARGERRRRGMDRRSIRR